MDVRMLRVLAALDPRGCSESWPHSILEEEWEHHRFAVRDLDAIEAKPGD
jgi:hypothetical protein